MLENSEKSDNENTSDTKKIKENRPVVATIEALDIRPQLSPVVLIAAATSSSGPTGSRGTTSTEVTGISELNIVSVQQLSQEDDGGNGEEPATSAGRGETAAVSTSSGPVVASNSNGASCGYFGYAIEDAKLPLCLIAKRHLEPIEGIICETQSWRIRERMKTVSVALVLCLNIGVDPPDIVKIQPCARLECWIDPSSVSPQKAMELIGANLQKQYERWQPRARYKKFHDPTVEDVKKLCTSLRRNAKEERVLFHYNGHGVPRPTSNGEIWVFNKTYTQYIPLSIYDLQTWMGAPSIYVYDCSNAGIIVNSFNQFAEQHEREMEQNFSSGNRQSPSNVQMITYKNCIQLAACSANQILPMNAKLPADLFTSCLTTPIKIALKWYTMQRTAMLAPQINQDLIEKIPGQLNDRRTMLGELNWIFTAITDTIAWNTLPRDLFQKLFRQDLLVASLFRNFLLAERILRSYDCTPVSSPSLPQGSRHAMWSAWDLAVDLALLQLPDILEKGVPYKQLPFFEEQLTAFQVWLDRGTENRSPPEQLPIVLQVLLSQVHRLRALELLGRFLDLGPWAVNLALGVGIFPYVLKLLQSSAKELRPVLVFIWAKILAVDSTCQVDLVKDHKYFLSVLQDSTVSKKHRTLSAFVLASIVHNFLIGQTSALQGSLVSICLVQIYDESWLLRQWLTICLGQLWQNFAKARWSGVRDLAHEKLYTLLQDPVPEVRAAAVFALGTYISSVTERSEHANNIDRFIAMTLLTTVGDDMSPMVRLELVSALQWMIILFENQFVTVYLQDSIACTGHSAMSSSGHHTTHSLERNINMKRVFSSSSIPAMGAGGSFTTATSTIGFGSIYMKLWQGIMNLGRDPYPKVAEAAQTIIEYVRNQAVGMIAAKEAASEKYGSSLSLPPSPNTRTNYLGESPPTAVGAAAITHHHHHHNPLTYAINSAAVITAAVTVGHSGGHSGGGGKTSPSNQRTGANTSNNTRSTTPTQHYQQQQHVGCNCGTVGLGVGAAASGAITGATASARSRFTSSNMPTQPSKMRTISSHDDNESRSYTAATGQDINPHSHQQQQQQQQHHHHYHHHHHGQQQQQQQQQQPVAIQQTHQQQQQQPTKPLVTTNFIPWAISYFARSTSSSQPIARFDPHSPEFRSRQWRFVRNEYIRRISREQQQRAIFHRIDTQSWIGKTQSTPSIVKLLPYEQQIAVAYKEKVSVHDWARGTYYSFVQQQPTSHNFNTVLMGSGSLGGNNKKTVNSPIAQTSRVTAMEFINAHDNVMILVGYEDGMIRIWQEPNRPNGDIRLVTAWQGLPSSTRISKDICGLVTTWHQKSQQLCVGGCTRFLRIWDAEKELKICDIPTGSDSSVRVLSSSPNELIAAGCDDGSVRLFDKRCPPSDARIMTYREHSGAIITACLRDNCESLVSGCSLGKIRLFDVRGQSSVQNWYVGNDVTSIAVHTGADIVACGSQYISIFGLDGRHQTSLRSHEGFMGTKISHTSCLSFHPHKVILAGGFVDNTVAVYVSSGNNRIT